MFFYNENEHTTKKCLPSITLFVCFLNDVEQELDLPSFEHTCLFDWKVYLYHIDHWSAYIV